MPPSASATPHPRGVRIKVFVIPVPLLTDMEPDPSIQEWAPSNKVRALYGSDRLVCRLVQLAEELGVNHPPTAQHIQREVEAVTRGLVPQAKDDRPRRRLWTWATGG